MNIQLLKLEGSRYRSKFKFPKIDWCSFVSGKTLQGSMTKIFTSAMLRNKAFPECPFTGKFEFLNMQQSSNIKSLFPSGKYRSTIKFFNDDDDNMVTLSYDTSFRNNDQ